ncbi:hypothetical protein TAMA11512_06050 [Selenomonas sp. TAMA-11512]|nr:hypothetical protein TAMA11512_06050 [Selenomonas sp. TAMA-11512]
MRAEDFAFRGLALGAPEKDAVERFGEPSFTKDVSVYGIRVKYLVYGRDFQIGIAARTGNVVDFLITDENYVARDGVTRGATRYKIVQTYGSVKREMINGKICYIYPNPEEKRQRFIIEGDPEQGYLRSMRITELPISVEEADAWAEEDETFFEDSLFAPKMDEKDIGGGASGQESEVPKLKWVSRGSAK